jgi:hypothetical protein
LFRNADAKDKGKNIESPASETKGGQVLIKVVYHDGRHDMVKPFLLDSLLDSKKVKMFYRSDGWATVGISPLRSQKRRFIGKEKRQAAGLRSIGPGSPSATVRSAFLVHSADVKKRNCWDVMKCGRQAGGRNILEFGVCPASTESRLDGIHEGKNAGRACWVVAGTMCHGIPQGTFAQKTRNCGRCPFYLSVRSEEEAMVTTLFLLQMCQADHISTPEVF